jgi:hypothetical protein
VPLTHGGRILDFSMIGQETGENGLDFNFVDGDEEENMEVL